MSDDDDDIPVRPKKKALKPRSSAGPSQRFFIASGIVKLLALAVGGFIALVSWMSLFGLVVENSILRLVLALIPTLGVGMLVTDRLLKRVTVDNKRAAMVEVLAVLLLAQGLVFLAIGAPMHNAFTKEGDRYARTGSLAFARATYVFGGKSVTFPDDDKSDPKTAASAASANKDAGKTK